MRIGFNYWMVVVPLLYALGVLIGYFLIKPGKRRALKRPFGWRSDKPAKVIILSYSTLCAIVTTIMLFVESHLGIIELMGASVEAVFLTPVITMACGTGMFYLIRWSMVKAYRAHVRALKKRWKKCHSVLAEPVVTEEVSTDTAVVGCEDTVIIPVFRYGGTIAPVSEKIVAMPTKAHRRRRRWWQFWNDVCKSSRKRWGRIKDHFDPMLLPKGGTRF